MAETIKVTIANTGEVSYEVSGVKGAKCTDLTKAIDSISNTVVERKKTGEFCQVETQQHLKQGR